jgi:sugar phosphate permease
MTHASTVSAPAGAPRPAGTADLRESASRWWLLILLITGMICCYAQRGTLSIAAPFMIKELGLSRTVMGIMLSAFSWCYAFMQVPAGWIVDRFGVRRAYSLGFALWSAACAITGVFRNIVSIMAFRILVGIGQSVAFPASARAVANWFHDRERGTVNAGYLTGVRLGQALINSVGAALILRYGWQAFFVIAGLIPLVWILPWTLFLRRWEQPRSTGATGNRPAPFTFADSFGMLRHRTVLGTFLGFFAFDYVWFVYVFWLPGYLVLERKFTPAEMSFYASVPFVVMSVVILISGLVTDRLIAYGFNEVRVRKSFIAVGFAIACLIVPAGLVRDNHSAIWLLLIALCGLGIASPNTWSITQALCAKNIVGTVSGIQNFGGNVGGILAPMLTGLIADLTHSFALAFGICGFILIGGALAYWLLMKEMVESDKD